MGFFKGQGLGACGMPEKDQNDSKLDKQDSKELSPRSLDKMLLKLQVISQNVQSTQLSKFLKLQNSNHVKS